VRVIGDIAEIARQNRRIKRGDWSRAMWFLLRLTFWIGLVLVLLPREKTPDSDKLPQVQINASDAISAATAAVNDMSQFCKRQPAACEVGGHAATAIGQRAQGGARKLYQIINDKRAPDHTGSIGNTEGAEPAVADTPRETLTADDLQIEWRGPALPSP
jgi:hypothetical protein